MQSFEPSSRIMSLSFERDPEEHAAVMLAAGRRFTDTTATRFTWLGVGGMIFFGAIIDIVMEAYRRFVLGAYMPIEQIPPLNIAVLQFLPFVLAIVLLYFGRLAYVNRARKKSLRNRFAPGIFIDTDIFREGLVSSWGSASFSLGWDSVAGIHVGRERIEIETDAFVLYLPKRAFSDRRAFDIATAQIRDLWQTAQAPIVDTLTENATDSGVEPL